MYATRFAHLFSALIVAWPAASQAIDWDRVPAKDITLLYPAQLSWEWLTDDDEHSGASKIANGRTCRSCHDGKEEESGALVVDYKSTEPSIIAGKPGALKARVKAAHDAQKLFIQIQFDTAKQPNAMQDSAFSDKVAVMIDDGGIDEAKRVGCWIACHADANSMKNGTPTQTKYVKDANASRFFEYWQARLNAGKPPRAVDGLVANQRSESKTPLVQTEAAFENGVWTVMFSRDLKAAEGRKAFKQGQTYTLGFAIHAGNTAHRFHYVSLEKTLVLDAGTADFVAASD